MTRSQFDSLLQQLVEAAKEEGISENYENTHVFGNINSRHHTELVDKRMELQQKIRTAFYHINKS